MVPRPDRPGVKKKPQVRGCRTLVLCGTGRQDSPGRGDGLGWTTSTPPDSNGVPRDVPDVSRSHREVPTNQKVRFDKKIKSASNVRFWVHQRKRSATIGSQTRGKSAQRSKPAKSRSDRPGFEEKPYGRRLADLGDLYQAARVPWSVRALPG